MSYSPPSVEPTIATTGSQLSGLDAGVNAGSRPFEGVSGLIIHLPPPLYVPLGAIRSESYRAQVCLCQVDLASKGLLEARSIQHMSRPGLHSFYR